MGPFDLAEGSPVILYLQGPKEKVWGLLLSLGPAGIVVRGLDLAVFDDWLRQEAHDALLSDASGRAAGAGRGERAAARLRGPLRVRGGAQRAPGAGSGPVIPDAARYAPRLTSPNVSRRNESIARRLKRALRCA